jgi:hypothetical protein
MALFNFSSVLDSTDIIERCGLSEDQAEGLFDHIRDTLKRGIEQEHQKKQEDFGILSVFCLQVPVSVAELAQAGAEWLNTELTPELGFAIGLYISHIKENAGDLVDELIKEGKIELPKSDM